MSSTTIGDISQLIVDLADYIKDTEISSHHYSVVDDMLTGLHNATVQFGEQREAEGRIDEVARLPWHSTYSGQEVFGYERIFRDNHVAYLKRSLQEGSEGREPRASK